MQTHADGNDNDRQPTSKRKQPQMIQRIVFKIMHINILFSAFVVAGIVGVAILLKFGVIFAMWAMLFHFNKKSEEKEP